MTPGIVTDRAAHFLVQEALRPVDRHGIGWGLHPFAVARALALLEVQPPEDPTVGLRLLEFGSGGSTLSWREAPWPMSVQTFDHNPEYADAAATIRPLAYYPPVPGVPAALWERPRTTVGVDQGSRAVDTFYALETGDLSGLYDCVVLDGPFGHGRSLIFPLLAQHLAPGGLLVIDDTNDYPFWADAQAAFRGDLTLLWETGADHGTMIARNAF